MHIIGCLLIGLLNPETPFYAPSAVAKKINGGKMRPHWREYAILYASIRALLDFLQEQQQKKMLIIFVQQPTVLYQNGR